MKIAEVVLPIPVDKSFSYSVPEAFAAQLRAGMRVKVPFGNRKLTGFVIKTSDVRRPTSDGKILKDIINTVDEEPVINAEIMKLCEWISSYYFCPLGKVLHAAVPVRDSRASPLRVVRRAQETSENSGLWPVASCQQDDQNLISGSQLTTDHSPLTTNLPVLTGEQESAVGQVKACIESGKHGVFLFEGPPRSGKTESCMRAIALARKKNRRVLVLVPEISALAALAGRLKTRFAGERIAVLHSDLKQKDYDSVWCGIKRGEADIVAGTRSAVFCPVENIGLIVVESEEDGSFKEQMEPRYHARDAAVERGRICGAAVILKSGSPSMESHYSAVKGRYILCGFSVPQGGGEVPEVEIIDKNQARQVRQKSWIFSSRLIEAIRLKLETGEKIFLFLNRRGFASLLLCDECGKGMHCPGCGVPLTFHKPDLLLCHRCNYSVKAPDTCPDCGKKSMRRFGMGTQQAFDELKRLFPQTPSGRLDADAAKDVLSAGQILADFRAGKTRILVGTQMAAGEELGGFGLLGVVLADFLMNIPDFRSPERTYQIISRLMGGLAAKEGGSRPLVIIQTYNPNHYVFSALKEGYDSFFRDESRIRRRLRYPPFSSLINLIISAGTEQKSAQAAEKIREALAARKGAAGRSGRFDMLGPAPAPVPVIRGKYRYEIMLKGKKTALDKLVDTVAEQRFGSKTEKVAVDVDPIRML